ncbi:MAG: AI-2E family transporter [Caldilineaceae bacterium]
MPYPIVLAVLAGLLEAIPVLGTALSLIIITGFALTQSLVTGLLTFGCMSGIQIVEGNILFPNIVGRQTHSSPLLSMFAFFAGLSVGGIVGGIIGVPVAAALRVLVVEVLAGRAPLDAP